MFHDLFYSDEALWKLLLEFFLLPKCYLSCRLTEEHLCKKVIQVLLSKVVTSVLFSVQFQWKKLEETLPILLWCLLELVLQVIFLNYILYQETLFINSIWFDKFSFHLLLFLLQVVCSMWYLKSYSLLLVQIRSMEMPWRNADLTLRLVFEL